MTSNESSEASLPPADSAAGPPSPGSDGHLKPNPQHHLPPAPRSTDATPSPAPESAANLKMAESQPMTASSSSSSHLTIQDSSNSAIAASAYGTRSRNRTGGPRPNYAEDQDKDLDFEMTSSASKPSTRKPHAQTNGSTSTDQDRAAGVSTRRTTTAVDNGAAAGLTNGVNGSRDGIPGTSSFSANPNSNGTAAVATSRKRKQPGSNAPPLTAPHHKSTRGNHHGHASSTYAADTNMMSFDNCHYQLVDGKLEADDGTILSVNDHVYLVCEPPGEPYYLARIMEFVPSRDRPGRPIESIRVNWYYRPKDVQKVMTDTRLIYATMHSDFSPITSLRGKCSLLHRDEIENLDDYRALKNSFYYNQLFDRYIHRYYEVVPTSKVINVPEDVKKVLDERWKFVIVESGSRYKELTSPIKTCKKCSKYAASQNSVDCSVCHDTYHMTCVRPVLTKKPTRGFGWACAPCSRAQERKLEARAKGQPSLEEEVVEEEEAEDAGAAGNTGKSTPTTVGEAQQSERPATAEQMSQAKLWPYRYLGIHCQVEDALDYDDRIYPRAASRLGPRHQANVNVWHGRPVEYVRAEKRRWGRGAAAHKKDPKSAKDAAAALEAEKQAKAKRPKWVMEEPPGFVRRGEDHAMESLENTAQVIFKMPDESKFTSRGGDDDDEDKMKLDPVDRERLVDEYMEKAKAIAPEIGVRPTLTNFLDKALEIFTSHRYDVETSLRELRTVSRRKDLKEPELSREEVKKFEEGVEKYGSELYSITKHVKTVKHKRIVRFYYMWKKTERGRQIWGNWHDRKGKKEAKRAVANAAKLVDDVADDNDDSAFDNAKALEKKRAFECKFCSTRASRQWRRAPETAPGTMVPPDSTSRNSKDKSAWLTVALCQRCALLWRKYAIVWENMEEVAKKVAAAGGRASKKRVDAELLLELAAATAESQVAVSSTTAATVASAGVPGSVSLTIQPLESTGKKQKLGYGRDKESSAPPANAAAVEPKKKLVIEKPPEPEAEPPRRRSLPCAVCEQGEPGDEQLLCCRDCRLTVHQRCYGISSDRSLSKWICDMCANDRNPFVSMTYECVLCPNTDQEVELFEAPRSTHKKKSDKERDKERKERELVLEAVKLYRQHQHDAGRAENPREPLKKTSGNHWAHVTCSMWIPEIMYGSAEALEPAEGFGLIPHERYEEPCSICNIRRGATIACHLSGCNARFHASCAFRNHNAMGFDITPVKSSRRDVVDTIKLGADIGTAVAAIWCTGHAAPLDLHTMSEMDESGQLSAMQIFARTYKQANLEQTGTVRKAFYLQQTPTPTKQAVAPPVRRGSLINGTVASTTQSARTSPTVESVKLDDSAMDVDTVQPLKSFAMDGDAKKCYSCNTRYSPRWWPLDKKSPKVQQSWSENRLSSQIPDDSRPGLSRFPEGNESGPQGSLHNASSPTSPNATSHGGSRPMGDVTMTESPSISDRPAPGTLERLAPMSYQCHKCHIKQPTLPSMNAEKPILAQSRSLQPHPSNYPLQPPLQSHSHPPPHEAGGGWRGAPQMHAPPVHSDWKSDVVPRGHEYGHGHGHIRNGHPPAQPNGIPPNTQISLYTPNVSHPPQQLNGYPPHQSPHPHHHAPPPPPPPQFPRPPVNGVPPPQFSPRQASFGNRPYSTSPPQDSHTRLPHHRSPQMPPLGPPRSSYPPVNLGPPPPGTHRIYAEQQRDQARDAARPSTPTDGSNPADGRPGSSSSGRPWSSTNGAGASASPSLRNLLS